MFKIKTFNLQAVKFVIRALSLIIIEYNILMIPYFWQVLFMSVYFMPVKRNWIHCLKQELFLSLIISLLLLLLLSLIKLLLCILLMLLFVLLLLLWFIVPFNNQHICCELYTFSVKICEIQNCPKNMMLL